jgi:uncharacterized membrane protein
MVSTRKFAARAIASNESSRRTNVKTASHHGLTMATPTRDTLRLVVFLLLAGMFLLIGVALTKGVPPNPVLGVRTAFTFSDPSAWRVVNGGTGILLVAVSSLAFYGIAALFESRPMVLLSVLAAMVAVVILSATFPAIPTHVYSIATPSQSGDWQQHLRLALAFGIHLAAGSVGLLLWKRQVPLNGFLGFRTRAFKSSEAAWYRGNGAAGATLFAGSAISVGFLAAGLLMAWHPRTLVLVSVTLLVVNSLASWAAGMAAIEDNPGERR